MSARKHGFKSYAHYLESSHWSNLKSSLGMFACACCSAKRPLVAHHIRYRDLIDVQVGDLVSMCFGCHDIFHIGCRKNGIDYIDIEADEIIKKVSEFKEQPWCLKRSESLKKRAGRKLRKMGLIGKKKSKKRKWKRNKNKIVFPRIKSYKREGNFVIWPDGRVIYQPHI